MFLPLPPPPFPIPLYFNLEKSGELGYRFVWVPPDDEYTTKPLTGAALVAALVASVYKFRIPPLH